jgi:hypothetical protein
MFEYIIHNLQPSDSLFPLVQDYNALLNKKKELAKQNLHLSAKIDAHRAIKARMQELLTIIKQG